MEKRIFVGRMKKKMNLNEFLEKLSALAAILLIYFESKKGTRNKDNKIKKKERNKETKKEKKKERCKERKKRRKKDIKKERKEEREKERKK